VKVIEIVGAVLDIFVDSFHKFTRKFRRNKWKQVLDDKIKREKDHKERLRIITETAKQQGCVVGPKKQEKA